MANDETTDETADRLRDGFLAVSHAPMDKISGRVVELANALDELDCTLAEQQRDIEAQDEQHVAAICATMERLPHYIAKAQKLAKDMHSISEKASALRKRTDKLEQKRNDALAKMRHFEQADREREAQLEAKAVNEVVVP